MVFSSNVFLFYFLPVALLAYYACPKGLRLAVLTLVSYLFYAWSDPRFVVLLVWVTVFDFGCGHLIARSTRPWWRRAVLALSLTNSLGLLAVFKYAGLGQELLNAALVNFGGTEVPVLAVVLPAGISFYTFESISYVVDIYRGEARPARSPVAFACYLAQFPHLVAGPIIRYQELEPQFHRPGTTLDRFERGIFFLSLGLAKKVLIADTVGRAVGPVFDGPPVARVDGWWAMFAFAFQLYFDFSGYSDMAVGLALMLGFEFPRNFDAPYRATSVTDFWRRWHMTLSRWLRDYLYIPLGGNRRGCGRTHVNLIMTMVLGGLWHGAALNFAAWGLYHGVWLSIERACGRRGVAHWLPRPVQVMTTFLIVCVGWVIFRSEDAVSGLYRLVGLVVPNPSAVEISPVARGMMYDRQVVAGMAAAVVVAFGGVQTWDMARRMTPAKVAMAIALFCLSVAVLGINSSGPFLYFQF